MSERAKHPRGESSPLPIPADLAERLRAIRLLILDVDGTMTDGTVWLGESEELKGFNIADGLGIKLLQRAGVEVAAITGRESVAVTRRCTELGIAHAMQGQDDKGEAAAALREELGLKPDQVASMGDDLPDLAVFRQCGVNFAVADAAPELRNAAEYTTTRTGGHGAVREAAEVILKAQNKWDAAVAQFDGET